MEEEQQTRDDALEKSSRLSFEESGTQTSVPSVEDTPETITEDKTSSETGVPSIEDTPETITEDKTSSQTGVPSVEDTPEKIKGDKTSFQTSVPSIEDTPETITEDKTSSQTGVPSVEDTPETITEDKTGSPTNVPPEKPANMASSSQEQLRVFVLKATCHLLHELHALHTHSLNQCTAYLKMLVNRTMDGLDVAVGNYNLDDYSAKRLCKRVKENLVKVFFDEKLLKSLIKNKISRVDDAIVRFLKSNIEEMLAGPQLKPSWKDTIILLVGVFVVAISIVVLCL